MSGVTWPYGGFDAILPFDSGADSSISDESIVLDLYHLLGKVGDEILGLEEVKIVFEKALQVYQGLRAAPNSQLKTFLLERWFFAVGRGLVFSSEPIGEWRSFSAWFQQGFGVDGEWRSQAVAAVNKAFEKELFTDARAIKLLSCLLYSKKALESEELDDPCYLQFQQGLALELASTIDDTRVARSLLVPQLPDIATYTRAERSFSQLNAIVHSLATNELGIHRRALGAAHGLWLRMEIEQGPKDLGIAECLGGKMRSGELVSGALFRQIKAYAEDCVSALSKLDQQIGVIRATVFYQALLLVREHRAQISVKSFQQKRGRRWPMSSALGLELKQNMAVRLGFELVEGLEALEGRLANELSVDDLALLGKKQPAFLRMADSVVKRELKDRLMKEGVLGAQSSFAQVAGSTEALLAMGDVQENIKLALVARVVQAGRKLIPRDEWPAVRASLNGLVSGEEELSWIIASVIAHFASRCDDYSLETFNWVDCGSELLFDMYSHDLDSESERARLNAVYCSTLLKFFCSDTTADMLWGTKPSAAIKLFLEPAFRLPSVPKRVRLAVAQKIDRLTREEDLDLQILGQMLMLVASCNDMQSSYRKLLLVFLARVDQHKRYVDIEFVGGLLRDLNQVDSEFLEVPAIRVICLHLVERIFGLGSESDPTKAQEFLALVQDQLPKLLPTGDEERLSAIRQKLALRTLASLRERLQEVMDDDPLKGFIYWGLTYDFTSVMWTWCQIARDWIGEVDPEVADQLRDFCKSVLERREAIDEDLEQAIKKLIGED